MASCSSILAIAGAHSASTAVFLVAANASRTSCTFFSTSATLDRPPSSAITVHFLRSSKWALAFATSGEAATVAEGAAAAGLATAEDGPAPAGFGTAVAAAAAGLAGVVAVGTTATAAAGAAPLVANDV
eukprot:Mycagemm_TRINITY_DN8242_c0_g1::TRINITY_DN8242_c0_g1_i1::g.1913::m.1913 type:complete len:129 gc:universal TRINITY_DN8242_c0_g1_i1:444-58(-)